MISPYKQELEEFLGNNVTITIDRDGAPALQGEISELTDFGCRVATKGCHDESSMFVFVAYKHIRGVGHEKWDPNKIRK